MGGGYSQLRVLTCMLLIAALIVYRNSITYNDEILYPYVFAILLASVYNEPERLIKDTKIKKISLHLGKISYYIFLLHYGICYLIKIYMPGKRYLTGISYYLLFVFAGENILQVMLVLINKVKLLLSKQDEI